MSIKTVVSQLVESNPAGRLWIAARRLQQRQRDWSTRHHARFGKTKLSILTTVGIGDVMIAKQVCQEFVTYCERHGDPRLGSIVITAGAWPEGFRVDQGDHNVYWWWSMNAQDDWLDRHLGRVNVKPDVVACLSSWCLDYARALGCRTLYLPLAVGESFQPLRVQRSGVGFAGSKGHKDTPQIACILGPFTDRPDFEWATNLKTPGQLSEFYNRKSIVLGMTEIYQEKTGMVNNRVFEVLATGTPFIIHRHRALAEVLGHEYPYQCDTPGQTSQLAAAILADYPKHLEIFERYQQGVEANHRYQHRLHTLMRFLAQGA